MLDNLAPKNEEPALAHAAISESIPQNRLRTRLVKLPELLAQWSEHFNVPGVSVGVLSGEDTEIFVHGMANIATNVAVSPDTLFQLGSNAKLWTATVVMKLVDEGLLDLDAEVVRYVPEFRLAHADAAEVTIRHLLTHTAGFLGDFFGNSDTDSIATYVEQIAELEQLHPIGELWSYCNSGWVLLGRVIEKVTELDYESAVRGRLLDPSGDTTTVMQGEQIDPLRTAMGYLPDNVTGALQEAPYGIMPPCAPAGSVPVSTPSDVLRFIRMHLDGGRAEDGSQVLSLEAVRLMQTPQVAIPDAMAPTHSWGLGWMLRNASDGQSVIGHGGGTPSGQVSMLEVVPDQRVAVVVLTNGGGGGMLAAEVVSHVLRELIGADLTPPAIQWPEPPIELDLSRYVGQYGAGGTLLDVRIADVHKGLTVTVSTSVPEGDAAPPVQVIPLRAISKSLFGIAIPGVEQAMEFLDFDSEGIPRYFFAVRLYPRRLTPRSGEH